MKIVGDEKPPLEELAHHGVKGQKWGVRLAHPTGRQILDARARQANRLNTFRTEHSRSTDPALSPRQKQAALARAKKAEQAHNTSEDRVTAHRLTLGEKAVLLMVGGPAGLVVLGGHALAGKGTARAVDKARLKA